MGGHVLTMTSRFRTGRERSPDHRRGEAGVVMVEATFGICLLLFVTLGAIQMILVFHGALAAHSAAARSARSMAIAGYSEAQRVYHQQMATALGALSWGPVADCFPQDEGAVCITHVSIPAVLPGGGLIFGEGKSLGTISLSERAFYPNFERAN